MSKHAITIRVDYDTLTELHKLTANSKINDFADVAGDLLDKAAVIFAQHQIASRVSICQGCCYSAECAPFGKDDTSI